MFYDQNEFESSLGTVPRPPKESFTYWLESLPSHHIWFGTQFSQCSQSNIRTTLTLAQIRACF